MPTPKAIGSFSRKTSQTNGTRSANVAMPFMWNCEAPICFASPIASIFASPLSCLAR
jgi:hypothetical protein